MTRPAALARARSFWQGRTGSLLRTGALLAIGAYLVHSVDLAGAWERARSANMAVVAVAVAILTAVHAWSAVTWRAVVVRLGGERMGVSAAVRAYYASQALGGITPGNLGGDAYRVVAARSDGANWMDAAAGVVVQRATSFGALAAIGVAALTQLPDVSSVALPLVGAAVGLALVLAVPVAVVVHRRAGAVSWRAFGAASAIGLAGGALTHAIAIAASYALVLAVDPTASGPSIVAAIALARLSLAVPIAPSGLGVQEGALAALFTVLGASPAAAVAASLLSRLALLSTTALGLVLASRRRRAGRPAGDPGVLADVIGAHVRAAPGAYAAGRQS